MVFNEQGYLQIKLDTGITLSGAANPRILYTKPNGVTGFWAGSVTETTKIVYQLSNASIDIYGLWKFQAFCTIGGLNAFGDVVTVDFSKNMS